jgi:RNA polymerase sigma factor (sigma-70 family)
MVDAGDEDRGMIEGLRRGEPAAVRAFCDRYAASLERLADRHIAPALARRFGPDDVVQSVCRTFLRRIHGGQFALDSGESLWRLLCAITLTKVRSKARYHLRQKRGLQREAHPESVSWEEGGGAFRPTAPEPGPDDQVAFAEAFEQLLTELDAEERRIIDLRLQDQTHAQIAAAMGISQRTVRRILSRLRSQFEEALGVA